jgi:methylthioribose-1-phosphate isomerase
MNVDGVPFRTIWLADDGESVEIIDQTQLPHAFEIVSLKTGDDAARAIMSMQVRGAPLIGATAAYGVCLGLREDASDKALDSIYKTLLATRPTAVNLRWALDDMRRVLVPLSDKDRVVAAYARAKAICDEDVAICRAIGDHGVALIRALWEKTGKSRPVNVLTHCNAGWLATVDWGTATAPIYVADEQNIPVHVWVDETRPRNQGASLTAWELGGHGIDHTVIVDNAGGHLMQTDQVDMVITGTDRTTAAGDVANKIGTYLKALAAQDNGIPFYVGLPGPTIDWTLTDGREIPIEERDEAEVKTISGRTATGDIATVSITPQESHASNFGFDVTPARLVTGLITERGVCNASAEGLRGLYPDRALRKQVIATARSMNSLGINQGRSGNVSARIEGGLLITPSGMAYDLLKPLDIVDMSIDGAVRAGSRRPSTEWPFHTAILAQRTDAGAVVHTHSPMATALSCLRLDIPAFHYMVAVAGGDTIRCAPYATFGTRALSDAALTALEGRKACLLANHGVIALGETLKSVLDLVVEVETLAGQYLRALQVGKPVILPKAEMVRVLKAFERYGKQPAEETK